MSSRGSGGDRGRGGGRGGPSRGSSPGQGPRGASPGPRGGRGVSPGRGYGGPGRGGSPAGRPGAAMAPPLNLPPAEIDPRLGGGGLNQLVQGLSKLKLQGGGGELPVRPDFGTLGRVVKLRSNYFPVQKFPQYLYEYDVKMNPSMKIRRVKRRLFELLENSAEFSEHAPYTANDGASKIIASRELPVPEDGTLDISLDFFDEDEQGPNEKSKKYVVSIAYITRHETNTLTRYLNGEPGLHAYDTAPVIAAFNIVLLKHALSNGGINVGRNRHFFRQRSAEQSLRLDSLLVAYRGFYLSVRPNYKQLSININVATTAFYQEGNLADALDNFGRETFGANPTSFVKGLRIKTVHLNHKKTVQRVGRTKANAEMFDHPTYGKISVQQYFKKQYKKDLIHPNAPLVDIGSKAKPNWVPSEMCNILPDQPYRGKLSANQTRAMIDIACLPPSVNQAAIYQNGLPQMGMQPASDALTKFGMSLGDQMAVVPGRILDPPRVAYAKSELQIRDSAWNLRDVQFYKGAKIGPSVAIVMSERRGDFDNPQDQELVRTVDEFMGMCAKCGMNTRDAKWAYKIVRPPPRDRDQSREQAVGMLRDSIRSLPARPVLALVILSNDDKILYAGIKTLLDVTLGVVNVCVISQKFRKNQPQYFANVALKVNMKLGGVNHVLTGAGTTWLVQKPTMLMGADVTHPSPGSLGGTPSIASVVASVDSSFARYPASMQLQETRKEMITELVGMTKERLKAYEAVNGKGKFPERIIMFRDGVSEGQFLTVVREELPQVVDACNRVANGYKPKVTYVIAGKRHHTRFYPVDDAGTDARNNGNPKCGMVVDKGVTGVYTFDFFLQSHVGLKGHARPTHYTVVHDENKFTADELQRLCHELSHTFARATRGVSLIPPAYYADLACERGRCYIHGLLNADSGSVSGRSMATADEEAAVFDRARKLWGNGPHPLIQDKMYYI